MNTLSTDGTSAVAASGPHRRRTYRAEDRTLPEGMTTVADLTEWAGTDTARAQVVLDSEQARDKPRSTLLEAMESVLTDPAPVEPEVIDSSEATADEGEGQTSTTED